MVAFKNPAKLEKLIRASSACKRSLICSAVIWLVPSSISVAIMGALALEPLTDSAVPQRSRSVALTRLSLVARGKTAIFKPGAPATVSWPSCVR